MMITNAGKDAGIVVIPNAAVTAVDKALLYNAVVMGACAFVVLLVADANWPAHMGEEQGMLIDHVISIFSK